ncbi:hypothetical protein, partial [Shewanella algae]|uniref:hypothetical protein n=1 Tax=Shewanella algae TaxID=38313 RepID=UPI00313CB6FA
AATRWFCLGTFLLTICGAVSVDTALSLSFIVDTATLFLVPVFLLVAFIAALSILGVISFVFVFAEAATVGCGFISTGV